MNKLSTSAKEAIIQKVLAKDGRTMIEIAKSYNIGISPLSKRLKIYRNNGTMNNQKAEKATQVL